MSAASLATKWLVKSLVAISHKLEQFNRSLPKNPKPAKEILKSKSGGQVSILAVIIFVVFITLFGMVVNVGLVVHDKVNLQNSVDIAAYYGAMKQAQVLNAIAHVNYQLRQLWKLYVWRQWVLGNSGRITKNWPAGASFPVPGPESDGPQSFASSTTPSGDTPTDAPVMCVSTPLWVHPTGKKQPTNQNACWTDNLYVPTIPQLNMGPFQLFPLFSGILSVFAAQSAVNSQTFNSDLSNAGAASYLFATEILASYKMAVALRREAIWQLQKLLIGSQSDFQDIGNHSVKTTAYQTFMANLTPSNAPGAQFHFYNSLATQPFLVPIDVEAPLYWQDFTNNGKAVASGIKDTFQPTPPPDLTGLAALGIKTASLMQVAQQLSACDFGKCNSEGMTDFNNNPQDHTNDPSLPYYSTVGFEKDPWILAYVGVWAQTTPRMLFSPFTNRSAVTLTAEAFAMPFGGRIGPWYGTQWQSGNTQSDSSPKVDNLLPPREGSGSESSPTMPSISSAANYSRYPDDKLGARSQIFQDEFLDVLIKFRLMNTSPINFINGDYGSLMGSALSGSNPTTQQIDPLVTSSSINSGSSMQEFAGAIGGGGNDPLRASEVAAVAPDIFDVTYYSISRWFSSMFRPPDADYLQGQQGLCSIPGMGLCSDLGAPIASGSGVFSINQQDTDSRVGVSSAFKTIYLQPLGYSQSHYWYAGYLDQAKSYDFLNSGWTQESTNNYNPSGGPTMVGKINTQGGRSGYSIKIVSKNFLKGPYAGDGGQGQNPGPIGNKPPDSF